MSFLRGLKRLLRQGESESTLGPDDSPQGQRGDMECSIENVGSEYSQRLLEQIVNSPEEGESYFEHLMMVTARFRNDNPILNFTPPIQIEIGNDLRVEITITDNGVYIIAFDTSDKRFMKIMGTSEQPLEFSESLWSDSEDGFSKVLHRNYQIGKDPNILRTLLIRTHDNGNFNTDEKGQLDSFLFEAPRNVRSYHIQYTSKPYPWKDVVRLPGTKSSMGVLMDSIKHKATPPDEVSPIELIIYDPQNECFIRAFVQKEPISTESTFNYQVLESKTLGFWIDLKEFINTFPVSDRIDDIVGQFSYIPGGKNLKIVPIKRISFQDLVSEFRQQGIPKNLDLTTIEFYLHDTTIQQIGTDNDPWNEIDAPYVFLEYYAHENRKFYIITYNVLFPDGNLTKVPIVINRVGRTQGLKFEFTKSMTPSSYIDLRKIKNPLNSHGGHNEGSISQNTLTYMQLNSGIRSLLLTLGYADEDIRSLISESGPLQTNDKILEMLSWFAIGFLPGSDIKEIASEEQETQPARQTSCRYCGKELPPEALQFRKAWESGKHEKENTIVKGKERCPHCQAPVESDGDLYYLLAQSGR